MKTRKCDVAIIGAGPAGMSAALTATHQGASIIVIDDSVSVGGHYYKSLPGNFESAGLSQEKKDLEDLRSKTKELESSKIEILYQARVWGIFRDGAPYPTGKIDHQAVGLNGNFNIHIEQADLEAITIDAKAIILAPGVYDRSLPFPGWELPGVITPGAAQMMIQKQGLLPGNRVLVCGTGALQITVAASLAEAGAEVVAYLDTSGVFDSTSLLLGALGGLKSRVGEALHSIWILAKKRVPIHFRYAVFRANADSSNRVKSAVIGKVDLNGHPIPGTEQTLKVDTICCAYGFLPSIELTLHLGCDHVYDPVLSAYVPRHNEKMQTSQNCVFVAGDITGIEGKPMAELQGKIAGISVSEELGLITPENAILQRKALSKAIHREKRFARWLWKRYGIKKGLLDLVEEDTVICRCENVLERDLEIALEEGGRDLYGLKLRTRLGMGSCQGRYCMMNAAMLISKKTGIPVEDLGIQSVRPPLSPVRLKHVAEK